MNLSFVKSTKTLLALVGVFLVAGIALRLFAFGQIPIGTYWDETAMILDAKSIAQSGEDIHGNNWLQAIYPSYGDYKLPVYIWVSSFFARIVYDGATLVRLPSLLTGLLTIVVAAMIAWEVSSAWKKSDRRLFALAAATTISISYWSIFFSRVGFEAHLGQLFIALAVWSFLRTRKSPRNWLLASAFGVLALFTYYSTRFIWFPLLLLFVVRFAYSTLCCKQQRSLKTFFPTITALLIAVTLYGFAMLSMSTSSYYSASQEFRLSSTSIIDQTDFVARANTLRSVFSDVPLNRLLFHRWIYQGQEFVKQFATHLSPEYIFLTGDSNLRHGTGKHGVFPFIFAPLLGLVLLRADQKLRFFYVLCLTWWFLGLLPASVPTEVPHTLRSLNGLLPLSLLIGLGVFHLLKLSKRYLLLQYGFFSILFVEVFAFSHYLFVIYPSVSASYWQAGYHELAREVQENASRVAYYWVNIGDGRFFLWSLVHSDKEITSFQDLDWQSFQLSKIENISFSEFSYTRQAIPNSTFAIAGRRSDLEPKLQEANLFPDEIRPILDSFGQEQFIAAYFNSSD